MKEHGNPRLVAVVVRHGAVDSPPALGLTIAAQANAGRTHDVARTVEADKGFELKRRSEGNLQCTEVDTERVDVEGEEAAVDYDNEVVFLVSLEQVPGVGALETKVLRREPKPREQMEIAVGQAAALQSDRPTAPRVAHPRCATRGIRTSGRDRQGLNRAPPRCVPETSDYPLPAVCKLQLRRDVPNACTPRRGSLSALASRAEAVTDGWLPNEGGPLGPERAPETLERHVAPSAPPTTGGLARTSNRFLPRRRRDAAGARCCQRDELEFAHADCTRLSPECSALQEPFATEAKSVRQWSFCPTRPVMTRASFLDVATVRRSSSSTTEAEGRLSHASGCHHRECEGGGPLLPVLDGTPVDARRYPGFLQSDFGGAWRDNEIVVLENRGRDEILSHVRAAYVDYSVVVFSGHGEYVQGQTRALLNSYEQLWQQELVTPAKRQLLDIIDACRALEEEQIVEARRFLGTFGAEPNLAYRASCRTLYDQYITRAEEGISVMYACSVNQAAQENSERGGFFSYWLTRLGAERAASNRRRSTGVAAKVLLVPEAFDLANKAVAQQHYPQQPVLPERTAHAFIPVRRRVDIHVSGDATRLYGERSYPQWEQMKVGYLILETEGVHRLSRRGRRRRLEQHR